MAMIKSSSLFLGFFILASLVGCSVNKPLRDFESAQHTSEKLDVVISNLESKGYACSEVEMSLKYKDYFEKKAIDAQKHTCTKYRGGVICSDYLFIDIYSEKNKILIGGGQVTPMCP